MMKITLTLILVGLFHLSTFSQINQQISAVNPNGDEIEVVEYELIGGTINAPLMPGDIVIPFVDSTFVNGITTYDIVLISNHIINLTPFQEDWQKIAADVNQDGNITVMDMVIIKKIILGLNTPFDFPNNNPWVFLPSQLEVTADTDFPFEFLGIKLGNVNPFFFKENTVETRTLDGTLNFFTKDLFLEKGKTYSIPVFSKNYKSISGGQFTLEFDPQDIEFKTIESHGLGGMDQNDFGFENITEGLILSSWVNTKNKDISKEEAFFNLKFIAKKEGQISDLFSINSQKIKAEAYVKDGSQFDFWNIRLDFESDQVVDRTSVFPNPFSMETNFTFDLQKSGSVVLDIFDVSGKMVFTRSQTFPEGQNKITVNQSDLSISGLYFYKIQTGEEIFSGKLILK